MKMILAGNHGEFIDYCQRHGMPPNQLIEVNHPDDLMGRRSGALTLVGTWYERNDTLGIRRYAVDSGISIEHEIRD